jgi:hypothetical protein
MYIQDPPAAKNILVISPDGKKTGRSPEGLEFKEIPGSMYLKSGQTGGVIIANPVAGNYRTLVTGTEDRQFTLSATLVNLTKSTESYNLIFKDSTVKDNIQLGQSKRNMMLSYLGPPNQKWFLLQFKI